MEHPVMVLTKSRVGEHCDFRPLFERSSEMVGATTMVILITNRKLQTVFRFLPKLCDFCMIFIIFMAHGIQTCRPLHA